MLLLALGACIKHSDPDEAGKRDQEPAAGDKKAVDKDDKAAELDKAHEKLSSLGYVDGTVDKDIDKTGVLIHHKDRAYPGYNFYNSRRRPGAQLIDMEGKVLHEWKSGRSSWQHATLLPNGDVIYLVKDKELVRIDKDSKVLWRKEVRAHHDLWVDDDGKVYALARRLRDDNDYHPTLKTLEDYILILDGDGNELGELSVLGAIEKSPYKFLLSNGKALPVLRISRSNARVKHREYDILHTNHVEVLDGTHAKKHPAFKKGNLLISPRNINAPIIIDPKTEKIVWIWGPNNLIYPHHPTMTEEGTMLVFNNGTHETRSQVIELDPVTHEVLWTYGPTKHFYSKMRGGNYRMPNGTTLITESDTGYVFEVDREGRIVWKFVNPHIRRKSKMRMAIWRMTRFEPDELEFEFNRADDPEQSSGPVLEDEVEAGDEDDG